MNKNENLIDFLFEKSGMCYLSDLHLSKFYPHFLDLIETTRSEDYDLKEWIELSNYMLNEKENFTSSEDVREHLLNKLIGRREGVAKLHY